MRPILRGAWIALVACGSLSACHRPAAHPPIILISIDTLRADHVSSAATPRIAALAKDSLVFSDAWSHCPLTLPSHLSILTGLLPPDHGVRDNLGYPFDAKAHPTLAARLREGGYRSGAAVSAYVLRASTGVANGFDDYDDAIGIVDGAPLGALQRPGDVSEHLAERWIAAHHDEPFFYFLHLYEPHAPYERTYEDDVARADAIVGRFIEYLKRERLYDGSMIVLLSDHGEGLMDHGESEHGVLVYAEDLRVPLMVKVPGGSRTETSSQPAALIDVAPTILEVAGVAASGLPGRSLLHDRPRQPLYAESLYGRVHFGWHELRSLVDGGAQYIEAPHAELYDLHRDPRERRNVLADDRRRAAAMSGSLGRLAAAFRAPAAVDAEEAKKLAALGYVSAGVEDAGGELPDPKEHIADVEELKSIAAIAPAQRAAKLEALLARNPRWSDVREQLGAVYEGAGDPKKAVAVYEDGIRNTPRLAAQYALSAATALLMMRDFARAQEYANAAAAGSAQGAHLILGEIALARGDLGAAQREDELAARSTSQLAHALFLSARIAAGRHDYGAAMQLLNREEEERQRTHESLPEHFHYVLGDVLAHAGRIEAAKEEMRREIAADPNGAQAYADLGVLCIMTGDNAGAQTAMAAAKRLRSRW